MEKSIEMFLENVSPKEIKEVLENHLSKIVRDDEEKDITLVVDKRYAMNELHKSRDIQALLHTVHKVYGEDYTLTLKLQLEDLSVHQDDEEVFVPHMIRY